MFNRIRCARVLFSAAYSTTYQKRYLHMKSFILSSKPFEKYKIPVLGFSILTLFGFSDVKKEDDVIIALKRSTILIERDDLNAAEQMLHVALRLAQNKNDRLATTYTYDVLANLALERGQLEKAKKLFVEVTQRLLQDGISDNDVRVVHINLKLARISHLLGKLQEAQTGFDWCMQKLKSEEQSKPTDIVNRLIALAEEWYGRLLIDGNRADQGLIYVERSFQRISKMDNPDYNYMVMTLNDLAALCARLDKLEKAEGYLKQAIELAKDKVIPQIGAIHVNLGLIYLRKNMIDEARRSCGFGYRLAFENKDEDTKREAWDCMNAVKNVSPL